MAKNIPRLVVAAGVSRSGSTWAYNAILELLGANRCVGFFSTSLTEAELVSLSNDSTIVLKTHTPSQGLKTAALTLGFPIVVTVRDPRDCVASFMKQFGWTFEAALAEVSKNFEALHALVDRPEVVLVKYESGEAPVHTIQRIADRLGIQVDQQVLTAIADKLSPTEVKKSISRLFPGKDVAEKPSEVWDPVTHWHPKHIGDGKVGKYKKYLTRRQIAMVDRATENYTRTCGYEPDSLPALESGESLEVGTPFFPYPINGFSLPEGWGTWITQDVASFSIPLSRTATSLEIYMDIVVSYNFFGYVPGAEANLAVNGRSIFALKGDVRTPENMQVVAFLGGQEVGEVRFDFRFSGLKSPVELQLGGDDRTLGLAVSKIRIVYN